jgi:hypothetical protein
VYHYRVAVNDDKEKIIINGTPESIRRLKGYDKRE